MINMTDGRALGFQGDNEDKYANVASVGEAMKMTVLISGGDHSYLQMPFMIFNNKDRNHPIRGVPDNIPYVCYRTGPKKWIYQTLMEI